MAKSSTRFFKIVFVALYAFGVIFTSTKACDGYKIKVNKLQACDNSGTVKIINPKIQLTQDCLVTADGCLQITKGFSSCKVVYDVNKKGMMIPFKGEKDICEELATASKNPAVATNLIKYNIGTRCPVKEKKVCVPQDQKMDVSNFKSKFRLISGQYTGTITLDCDSGKSCFSFDVEFKRGK